MAQIVYYTYKDKDYGLPFEEVLKDFELKIDPELKKYLFNLLCLYANPNNDKVKIKNSHAKEISGMSNPINSLIEVVYYAEPACQEACIDLFSKGIETTYNDTPGVYEDKHVKNLNEYCEISINYMSLSPENKKICDELIKEGLVKTDYSIVDTNKNRIESNRQKCECTIYVPCNSEETIGEVSKRLQNIINRFQNQDILYGRMSFEELINCELDTESAPYHYLLQYYDEETQNVNMSANEVAFLAKLMSYNWEDAYYDEEEDTIYRSSTLYKMHKEYLEHLPKTSMNV